jgi:hypothetical protein
MTEIIQGCGFTYGLISIHCELLDSQYRCKEVHEIRWFENRMAIILMIIVPDV